MLNFAFSFSRRIQQHALLLGQYKACSKRNFPMVYCSVRADLSCAVAAVCLQAKPVMLTM